MKNKTDTVAEFDIRNFFKRWPRFYYGIAWVFGPMLVTGLSVKAFLRKYPQEGKVLNIGSGPRVIDAAVINVDIHPYPGVAIISSGNHVPLPDASVTKIISETVLEHVDDPVGAVDEMHRLLVPGGLVYATIPFLYPFHSSPFDYQRWTKQGVLQLFKNFEIVEVGVYAGPFSSLTVQLNHMFAVIFSFGSQRVESLLVNLVMFVTFPIKWLDLIFNFWPRADEIASILYLVAKKK